MLWLPVACLFEFGFAQLFKASQRRGHYAPVVVSANYLTLSSILGLYLWFSGGWGLSAGVLKVGVTAGCVFIFAVSVMTRALTRANVAPVLTAFRMAVILPVAASVVIWKEVLTPMQFVGVGLALLALFLMTWQPGRSGDGAGLGALWVVLPVFFCQGVSHTCLRWVHYAGLDDRLPQVIMVIGATAGTLGALRVLAARHRPGGEELAMGCGIGVYNLLALLVILTALSRIPGALFFPVLGCAVVIMDNVSAHFYWKELLSRPAVVGVAVAIGAIVMVLR